MKSSKLKYYITMILISLSLISIGFASWVFNVGSDISTDANGNINTDEIKREYSFEDFGIVISSTTSNIEYAERNGEYIAINHSVVTNLTFDISNSLVKDMDFQTSEKIGIFFTMEIFNTDGTTYNNSNNNKIDGVFATLSNYEYINYPLMLNNNTYYIPLKSKANISLYSLCLMDSTIPNKTDYKVPFKIVFNMTNFNYDIAECTFKINIRVGDINE